MPLYSVYDIVWDTDGNDQGEMGLPTDFAVYVSDPEDIADALSDEFGWAVSSIGDYERVDSGPDPMSLAKAYREDQLTD